MHPIPPLDPARAAAEFAPPPDGTRRDLLRWIGGSLAATALTGCDWRPDEHALPYVDQPEQVVPGRPLHYATAWTFEGVAQPVVAECHEGRPTKLEGNPRCPASGGATDAFTQAAILELYDPRRSRPPSRNAIPAGDAAVDTLLSDLSRHLAATGGAGFRLLTGPTRSPTLLRQVSDLLARLPGARWCVWDPFEAGDEPTRLAFGRPLDRRLHLDRAAVVVSLDDDLLGPGPLQTWHAGGWSRRRAAFQAGDGSCRLFMAEPGLSLTGIAATDRLAVRTGRVGRLAAALEVRLAGGDAADLDEAEARWVSRAADALRRHPGAALVSAGASQPADVQAACLRLSAGLGAIGRTIVLTEPEDRPAGRIAPEALLGELRDGIVETLVVLDANPVLTAPAGLDVAGAIGRAGLSIHLGPHRDETAEATHWTLPLRHAFEDWGDARMADGAVAVIQPLVRPLFGGLSRHAVLAALAGDPERDPRARVRRTWREAWGLPDGDAFEDRWRRALLDGSLAGPAEPVAADAVPARPVGAGDGGSAGLDVLVRPDPRVWDGRFAWNPWLQETPDPVTKATWQTSVALGRTLADAHGIATGDRVRVARGDRSILGAAFVVPGMAADTVALTLGGAAKGLGEGGAAGYDPLHLLDGFGHGAGGATLARVGEGPARPVTQHVFDQQEFGHARAVPAPHSAASDRPSTPPPSLYPDAPAPAPNWGMAIDLDLCIGCNACVVACVAENNVPTVGAEQTAAGRHMYWLRIDRYDGAPGTDAPSIFQPVPCMHCEKAPCEMGCPVNATTHSPDGLNQQVYNRCIGTRTCSSYCPYKVRRFNWFDFTADDPEGIKAQRNPDVTVRGRGVMEKCTYCVQRISEARIGAKVEGRPIRDGEVVPACAQACPTRAITFGDITDPATVVSQAKAGPRHYALLEEVGTRPRTTYLARVASGESDPAGGGKDPP